MVVAFDAVVVVVVVVLVVVVAVVAVVVVGAEDKRHETVTSFAVYGARLQKMERG